MGKGRVPWAGPTARPGYSNLAQQSMFSIPVGGGVCASQEEEDKMSNAVLFLRIILGVVLFFIAVFITRAIYRINKIVDLLERISEDIRTVKHRLTQDKITKDTHE